MTDPGPYPTLTDIPPATTSVSARYLTRFVPIVVLVLFILVSIFGFMLYRSAYSDLEARLNTLIAREALLLGEAVAHKRDDRIGLLVAQTIADPNVATVAVLDKNGEVLNKYGPIPLHDDPLVGRVAINFIGEGIYQRVGTLIVRMSERPAIEHVTQAVTYVSLLGLLLIGAASLAAHLVLRKTVSEPLNRMLNAIRIQRESGAKIPVDWESRDQIGQVIAAYNALQLRQTRAESDLARLRGKALRAHQSKTDFVSRIVEEMRTPLNSIVGFSEIISSRRFGPDTIQRYMSYAGNINQAARHLFHLVENVLELTQLEGGEIEARCRPTEIKTLFQRAESAARNIPHSKGVRLQVKRPAHALLLNIDPDLMAKLLTKLLTNALQHTPEDGSVTLSADRLQDGSTEIIVSDTGPGIAEHDIHRLLIPFAAEREFDERRYHGTGLGLPISKALAEMHDGTIAITNRATGGMRISVLLPPSRTVPGTENPVQTRNEQDTAAEPRGAAAKLKPLHGSH